jgi:hypothetical protein
MNIGLPKPIPANAATGVALQRLYVHWTAFLGYTRFTVRVCFQACLGEEASNMSTQPVQQHKQETGSPYCSDPDCTYCRELRKASEQLRRISPSSEKAS